MDLKTSNATNSKNSFDSEKSSFEKFEADVKNAIFGVLFVLLKEEEMSIWVASIISIIEFFQILLFPFHYQIRSVWNNETLTDGLGKFVEYFQIVYYFKNTNWNVYAIMFYVGMALVVLVIVDFFYVSYSFRKKKFTFVWPIHALRSLCSLFVTILFLPLLDYFLSIIGCIYDNDGNYVHHVFTEVECWQGTYVVHGALAIIISVVFVCISLTVSITYFECRGTSSDPTARVTSRPNFLFNLYEAVMVLCFTFLNGYQYQYIILAVMLGGSTVLFVKFHYNSPYYSEIMGKLWSLLVSLNLWTVMMLVFGKIMENTSFQGSIVAWLIGLPFIIIAVFTSKDHRVNLLLINVNKFQNGEEIQNQIRYVLKLISWQSTSQNAGILLDGYIEVHKQTCNQEDCPLRQKTVKNIRLAKNVMGTEDNNVSERYALLIQLLYKMYLQGIKKFPNTTSLRISYSFFLLERMQSKQQALQELTQAEQNRPPFDEQFIIYRYKKIIEDEIAESQNDGTGSLDVVSEIAFQNHLRQCQAGIEKSALQHMEFWSQLSEDNPDLGKLNDIGSSINNSIVQVEDHWNKLLKINRNMPKAMRMYGKFLIEIINDKETGEELLEQARNLMNANNKRAMNMLNINSNDDFLNDSTPTIVISGEQEKFAVITGINLSAASLFGYNKTELTNRKLNVLMPQAYAKFHDAFIENYISNNENKSGLTSKERMVFGKHKSNYIFPFYITIKAVPSVLQGIQFISTLRVEKNLKNAGYVLTLPDGSIDAISSSCINLLKIDLKMITQKKSNITDFIPNILKDRKTLFSHGGGTKNHAVITFKYPKDSDYVIASTDSSVQLNCYLTDLVFLSGQENAGMQFRFEKAVDRTYSTMMTGDRRPKIVNFQFRFEKNLPKIIGEYVEGSSSDVNSANAEHSEYNEDLINSALRSNLGENELSASAFMEGEISVRKSPVAEEKKGQQPDPEVKKVDYGAGIKILRLVNGKATDILEMRDSEEAEEGEEAGEGSSTSNRTGKDQHSRKPEEEGMDDISQKEFNTTFKSRKALNQVINDRRPPKSIRNLKWVANILVLALIVLAAIDYFLTVKEFNDIRDNLNLITLSNQKIAELQTIVARCQDLYLLNLGINPNGTTEDSLKDAISEATVKVKSLVDTLQLNTLPLSDEHNILLQTNSVAMQLLVTGSQTSTTMFNLDQATLQVISRALNIINSNLTSLTDSNTDLYFVLYNNFNDFYIGLRRSSELYTIELVDRTISKQHIFLILLLVSAGALVVALIVFFPVLQRVSKSREEVLRLFLDIPEKTVKGLYSKCENFISNLQVGEDDDMLSEIEDESFYEKAHEEAESGDFLARRKRKRFKNSGKNQKKLFLKLFIAACCIEAYFIADYFLSANLLGHVNTVADEFNSTSAAEAFYSFASNAERQLLIDNKFPILKQDAQIVAVDNIKKVYFLDSEIHQKHSVNIQIHDQSYVDYFNDIMMQNPCPLLTSYVSTNSCASFADGAVYQGMAVDTTRHIENMRYLLTLYVNNFDNASLEFPDSTVNYTVVYEPQYYGNNQQRNNWLNILNTAQAIEVANTQIIYLQNTFRLLMAEFEAGMNSIIDKYITNRIILFVFFYVVLLGAYLVLWLPLVTKLNKDIWRTKSMLTMIPLNVVAKITSVKMFLKKFWNERTIENY